MQDFIGTKQVWKFRTRNSVSRILDSLKRIMRYTKATEQLWKNVKKKNSVFRKSKSRRRSGRQNFWKNRKTAQNTLNILEREAEKLNEKYTRYATYEKAGQYTLPEEISVEQMEARYVAITSVLSQELKDLEERETKASGRFQREQNELEHLQKKYR